MTTTVTTSSRETCLPPGFAGSRIDYMDDRSEPGRWWSGALHAHTVHSDGAEAPMDVLRRVREAGLDFVTITDHNNTTHIEEVLRQRRNLSEPPLWIAGEEITTPGGHANAWGLWLGDWIDFRVRPHERGISELVEAAHRQRAVISINHPTGACAGCSWEHEIPEGVDALEVWNGRTGPQDDAVRIWEQLLRQGRRVTAVGASDWHREPAPIDAPNVRVRAPALDTGAILNRIRAGRVIVMRAAADPTPAFTVRSGLHSATVGESLTIAGGPASIEIGAPGLRGGRAVVVLNTTRIPVPLDAAGKGRLDKALSPGYVRLETYDANGEMVAFTNPVYLVK